MRLSVRISIVMMLFPLLGSAQLLLKTHYDEAETKLKEEFYIRSKNNNVLDGPYKSYFESGGLKSEGQFVNNKSTGIWKYYYSNGRLRMQGQIGNGKNVGQWDYFYENGSKKMSGKLNQGKKDGFWVFYYKNNTIESEGEYASEVKIGSWKYYHEAGVLKAMEEFAGDGSYYEELYETGSIKSDGKIIKGEKVEGWTFYYEDGTVKAKGDFVEGKKSGSWQYFDSMGKIEAEGKYEEDLANGIWIYYHTDGSVASEGELVDGAKDGAWKMFYNDGTIKGEAIYARGDGEYKEYYKNGDVKVQGMVKAGLNNGRWQYFYENGKLEGTCDFVMGEGEYLGYYNDGTMKMKGMIKNDLRTGIWELYEKTGDITGYYKPYYEEGEATFFIAEDVDEQKELSQVRRARVGSSKNIKKKSRYFKTRIHEYKAFIIGYNPIAPLVGSLPISFEYYLEERLGYEIAAQYLRDPFFRSFSSIEEGTTYSEGFAITIRQKFYHKELPIGQPYFAHELKYSALYHSANISNQQVKGANENKIEYGLIIGTRFFKNVTSNGFTVDGFIGFGVGYRDFNQLYTAADPMNDPFSTLNSNNFAYSIRLGINLGFAFRIKR
jgi:antitoxin component YwqK of YwqJK toxin-antitoxin module